jgi:hypothetical protein
LELTLIIIGVFIVAVIIAMMNNSNEKKDFEIALNDHSIKLDRIEKEIFEITDDISKWVYSCKKCQNNLFIISFHSNNKLNYACTECQKVYELKSNNAFYVIESIGELHKKLNQLVKLIEDDFLHKNLMKYLINHYEFKPGYAPKNYSGYLIYDYYFNRRKIKYFSLKYIASKKSFQLIPNTFSVTKFQSNGIMLDEIEKKKTKVEMGKLNPNRPALSEDLEIKWNYKSITKGKKSSIIKKWAKSTNQKCPDGRKCGGKSFSELPIKDIAYGHIISQSFSKTFPHLHDKVHHPDNLYLTCKSCNSSLGGKNADDDLIDRIKNEAGTVGDWLRNYINDINSIQI